MIDPKLYALWKKYRSDDSWRGNPLYFKQWLTSREERKKIDWQNGRGPEIKRAVLEVDGFRVVVKVTHDEISRLNDSDCFGTYDDERDDHYAIDRHQGGEPSYRSRFTCDSRKRYYNEPNGCKYENQRTPWLNVCKPETVATQKAVGRRLTTPLLKFEARHTLSNDDVECLYKFGYIAISVEGPVLRRCRYNKTDTTSKSDDDLRVRQRIVENKNLVDGWYDDQWTYYDVDADVYKGDVLLGCAGCGGVDSNDDGHVDDMALEIIADAVRNAKEKFEEIKGTPDTRCALIVDIHKEAETFDTENEEGFDAWLGFLYVAIAGGEVLNLEEAPLAFQNFFTRKPELSKRVRLYVNGWEDE